MSKVKNKNIVSLDFRLIGVIFLFVFSLLLTPGKVEATCTPTSDSELTCGSPKPDDVCYNYPGGQTCHGTAYYSYAENYTKCLETSSGKGYYHHDYRCDTSCGSGSPTPTPGSDSHEPPADQSAKGYLDVLDPLMCSALGWTCDPDKYSQALNVNINLGTTIVATGLANVPREQAVAKECGGNANHGFNIQLPPSYRDSTLRSYSAIALGIKSDGTSSGNNFTLTGSPKNLACITCSISLPSLILNGYGDSRTVTPTVIINPSGSTGYRVLNVAYSVNNTSALSISPSVSSSSPFGTIITALTGTGSYSYTGTATITDSQGRLGGPTCAFTANVLIIPRAWWQVTNMDVVSGGGITSILPTASTYFDLRPGSSSSDTPGIPIYSTSINLGAGKVSETGWNVQTSIPQSYLSYNYNYFFSRVPAEVKNAWNNLTNPLSGNISVNPLLYFDNTNSYSFGGYRWILIKKNSSGVASLTINGTISVPSSSRYIFLVDGDLNINQNILVNNNGLIMFIVSGDINVDPNVTSISGIYLTNNQFNTGTRGTNQDTSLNITGSVVALNRLSLQRSLTNNDNPAEKFTLSPSFLLQIPYNFLQRNFNWREVNPGM